MRDDGNSGIMVGIGECDGDEMVSLAVQGRTALSYHKIEWEE